jgi:hypothetical protein
MQTCRSRAALIPETVDLAERAHTSVGAAQARRWPSAVLWRVYPPPSGPVAAASGTLTAPTAWSMFLWPLIVPNRTTCASCHARWHGSAPAAEQWARAR